MLGYWNQPGLTEEALRGGWLHTGDGGLLDEDGVLFVVDRVKDMIVSGGENVYSAETEQAIYAHPAIAECAVIGLPHDSWGEKVHAIVRLNGGESLTELELIEHCKTLIAAFKCPKSIEFREDPPAPQRRRQNPEKGPPGGLLGRPGPERRLKSLLDGPGTPGPFDEGLV